MEHRVSVARDYEEDARGRITKRDKNPNVTHTFSKMGLVKVQKGDRAGNITGSYIRAEIQVGPGPRQVSVDDLKELLETEEPIVAPSPEHRGQLEYPGPNMTIELGSADTQWKRKEIEEIIEIVEGEKPKRGRPKKDAGETSSGNGPATTGSVDS